MTKWVFIKVGWIKNRKWDLDEHLISALDLNLFQPLDLGIPQNSLRVRLKEGKEEKVIHSFMSRLREEEKESWRLFLKRAWEGEGEGTLSKSVQ